MGQTTGITQLSGEVNNNRRGYQKLAQFNHDLAKYVTYRSVYIDCTHLTRFNGSMGSILKAIILQFEQATDATVQFINLKNNLANFFLRLQLVHEAPAAQYLTVIPARWFNFEQHDDFAEYAENSLQERGVPHMSEELKYKFLESINEIYVNAALWSNNKLGVTVSGEYFPDLGHFDLSIFDLGQGFQESIRKGRKKAMGPAEAIDWAMQPGNTSRNGDIPGGLGLDIIKEFVTLNGGQLQVISRAGYWSLEKSGIVKGEINPTLPGSVINLVINTNDNNSYCLASEITSSGEIF